jgi:putative membrane protein insertion efficiency factor
MKKGLQGLIRIYRFFISPLLGYRCRFLPTCSEYGYEALEYYGFLKGLGLILRRLLRCHPWGGSGWDPVPIVSSKKNPNSYCGHDKDKN